MTQIQKLEERQKTVRQLLLQSEKQIVNALPKSIDGKRMFRVYMTAVQINQRLLKCEPMSLVAGVMQSAQFGLSLDPMLGEAYLVPRWNKHIKQEVATFQLGYKGLRKLALQADPDLQDIYAIWVYERDVFEYTLGDDPKIVRHIPSEEDDPGKLRLAYAVAVWKDGYKRRHIMLGRDIRKIRDNSDGYKKAEGDGTKNSPWHENEQEMWRKTALRALCNQMQLSSEKFLEALSKDDEMSGSEVVQSSGLTVLGVTTNDQDPKDDAQKDPLDAAADAAEREETPPVHEEVPSAQEPEDQEPPKATRRRRS